MNETAQHSLPLSELLGDGGSHSKLVQEFIADLLGNALAERNGFTELTLEQIGVRLGDLGQDLIDAAEGLTEHEDFEKCKSSYCMILIELELGDQSDFPTQTLAELAFPAEGPEDSDEPTGTDERMEAQLFAPESQSEPTSLPVAPSPTGKSVGRELCKFGTPLLYTRRIENLRDSLGHLRKLTGQAFCFAVEAEGDHRIASSLNENWAECQSQIASLTQHTGGNFELLPQLKDGLIAISQNCKSWLYEGNLPFGAFNNALRFLNSIREPGKMHFAPIEISALLLFFGQDGDLNGIELRNRLRVTGLSGDQIIELSFRLSRIQRFRALIVSVHSEFSEEQFKILEEDFYTVVPLLEQLRFLTNETVQQVA